MSEDPITARVCDTTRSLLMTSGAGCGKTYRMVERYQHLVAADVPVTRIVAVTFTEKAANELKDRVRRKCRERALESGEDAERWRQAARQLELAPIGTIHSFCARLLRENALAAGVDPRFRVLDEKDQFRLVGDTVRDTLLARVHSGEATARRIVARWGLDRALGIVRDALGRRESHARWLAAPPSAEEILRTWEGFVEERLGPVLAELIATEEWTAIVEALRSVAAGDPDDNAGARQLRFLDALAMVGNESVSVAQQLAAVGQCFAQGHRNAGSKAKWQGREGDLAVVKDALRRLADLRDEWQERLGGGGPIEDRPTAELAAAVCAEGAAAIAACQQAKREGSVLDFDDLEILARDLLRDHDGVRRRVQERYDHVLVDEFQDTNALQKEIIWYVAGGDAPGGVLPTAGKLFVVGDAKQSIYRFRGADVTVFTATEDEFEGADSCGVVGLPESRRSTPGIVAFHNELFGCPAVMGSGERADYEAGYEALRAWRGPLQKDYDVEVLLVEAVGDEDDSDLAVAEARGLEARALAKRIVQMVEDGERIVAEGRVEGRQTPRPVRYGDIALLFRAMTDVAVYESELRRQGIPYYTLAGRGFYHRQEVRDCLSLLGALENASDSLVLASALRSPAFAISDDTLFWLTRAEESLWSALERAATGELPEVAMISEDQHERLARAHTLLSGLRADKNRLSVAELVERVLHETGLAATLLSQYGGLQAAANLTKLTDLAREFEADGQFSLREFIDYLTALVVEEEREGLATIQTEAGDVVQLLTIHKAKGMEWPVVIVPDVNRRPRGTGSDPRWSPETGPVPVVEDEKGDTAGGAVAALLKSDDDRREEAEARRVLYVALTRAMDHLILSTSCQTDDAGHFTKAGRWLSWLAEALGLDPVPGDGAELQGEGWRGVVRRPRPGPAVWRAGRAPARAGLAEMTEALGPGAMRAHGDEERLRQAIEPVAMPSAELPRLHVTALSQYLACPQCYLLRYVLDLPERPEPGGWLQGMSATERGDLAHRVMELVGRDGPQALPRAMERASFPGGLRERAGAVELAELAEAILWFLEGDAYREWIGSAQRLRSEVPFAAVLEGAIVEGKIDALAEDPEGALRLLDYKTGSPAGSEDEHRFQIGLYCAAVQAATGALPVGARLVYLDARQVEDIPVAEAAEQALRRAREALEGIAHGRFTPGACPRPARCALAYACELA